MRCRDFPPGAAYVFEREEGIWVETARLSGTATAFDEFGQDVAIDGDTVAIGAPSDAVEDAGFDSQSVVRMEVFFSESTALDNVSFCQ